METGLNEIPIPANLDFPVKRGRKKQSKAKNLIDRCKVYQHKILSFMHNFSVPFSNNQAERDIRMVNSGRKFQGLSEVRIVLPHSAGSGGTSQWLRKMTGRFSHCFPALFREIHSHLIALTGSLNSYKKY
jgi:hypothetical protein